MNHRLFGGLVTLILCAACFARQSDLTVVEDLKGDFVARLTDPVIHYVPPPIKFKSAGASDEIQKNSEGLQINAHRFSGECSKRPDGTFNIDKLLAEQSAVIHYDSDRARRFQVADGLPPTDPAGIITELTSESVLFNQVDKDDKITLTDPFLLTDSRPGKNANGKTQVASRMTGSSGIFHFLAPEKGGQAKLKTADVAGPVHYHQVQTGISSKTGMPVTTEYDVVGDHLTADLSSPTGQIVLNGNVKWSSTSSDAADDGFRGTCSRLIATTDADGNITDLEGPNTNATSGSPGAKEKQP